MNLRWDWNSNCIVYVAKKASGQFSMENIWCLNCRIDRKRMFNIKFSTYIVIYLRNFNLSQIYCRQELNPSRLDSTNKDLLHWQNIPDTHRLSLYSKHILLLITSKKEYHHISLVAFNSNRNTNNLCILWKEWHLVNLLHFNLFKNSQFHCLFCRFKLYYYN